MIKKIVVLICCGFVTTVHAQEENSGKSFNLWFHLDNQSIAVPFQEMITSNFGAGIGIDASLNRKNSLFQQVNLIWFRNPVNGNGVFLNTQTCWRPRIFSNIYGEIKMGVGYLMNDHPVDSFKYKDGQWLNQGKMGKGMLSVPIGISILYQSGNNFNPFVGYQLMAAFDYNDSIPVFPMTILQFGIQIKL